MKIIKAEGGLGSQMLQVALYIELKSKDEEVYFDLMNYNTRRMEHNGWEVEKIFGDLNLKYLSKSKWSSFVYYLKSKLKKKIKVNNKLSYYKKNISKEFKEKELHKFYKYYGNKIQIEKVFSNVGGKYDKSWYKENENIYYVSTYFSEKYFLNHKLVREKFKFPQITEEENLKIKEKIIKSNSVAIHIRRGDYIDNPILGGLAPLSYYKKAIKKIKEEVVKPNFFIFSNDIKWCKENLELLNEEIYYIDWNKGEKSFRDMQLMSLCKHNIIPNSSFSWWAAWLNENPNKIVIAPEKWFSDESEIPSNDIVPSKWIKIKNY